MWCIKGAKYRLVVSVTLQSITKQKDLTTSSPSQKHACNHGSFHTRFGLSEAEGDWRKSNRQKQLDGKNRSVGHRLNGGCTLIETCIRECPNFEGVDDIL